MIILKDNVAVELITTAQNLTGSWADLGEIINTGDVESLALWLNLDINDSLTTQVRAVARINSTDTDNYELPITEVTTSQVNVAAQVYVLSDADQKIILPINLDDNVQFIQIQVKAGTVGATAGQIDGARLTRRMKQGN